MKQYFPLLLTLAYCLLSTLGLQAQTPVAHYAFSGHAKDSSSFANDASVNGATLSQDRFGTSNSAMDFDGLQGYVQAANAAHLNSANASVSFWVHVDNLPPTGEVYLLSYGGWQERWKISLPSHGKPIWTTKHSGGISDMDSGTGNELQTSVWTHLVMVHDGAKDKIYINGVMVAEKDVVGTLNNNASYPLGIGYNPVDVGNYFDGAMDEVMLFDVALDATQIAALYAAQNTAPTVPQGIVAGYSFDGNGADNTPFGNHADITTASLTTDRFGYGNSALLCDGASTEVHASNSSHLNSDATTVSFWIKPNILPATGEFYPLSFGGWQERWKISLPSHGKPVWTTNSSGGISDMDSGTGNELQTGEWTHLVMVHDGAKDKIYMNGAMVAEKDVVGTLNSTTHPLGIGYNSVDGGSWLDGAIDEVGIYNHALSDTDISNLYTAQSTFPGIPDSLVAHYSLNGNGVDSSQFGNHARLESGAVGVANRHGWGSNALSGAATAANSIALQGDRTSVSFWVKPDSLPVTGEFMLLSYGGWQERWKISLPGHGKPVWTTNSSSGISDMDSGTGNELQKGVWSHVVMVHDGAKNKIYMDGAMVAEKVVAGTLNKTKHPFGIGYNPVDGGQEFIGALDDVQIYNDSLSATEIAALYAAQNAVPLVAGDLVAHYGFSGNGLDATAFNNHATGTELGIDRFGKVNKAAAFDGVSTEVTAANSPQLNTPNTTVSFWINANSLPVSGEYYPLSYGGWQERWKISIPSHGKAVWTTNSSGGISDMDAGTGNELQPGVWTHLVMVHDGLKDKIYMNGVMVADKDVVGTLNNTTHPFGIGYNAVDGGSWFDGSLDEVQVYKIALDDTQIAALFAAQSQAPVSTDTIPPSAPLNLTGDVSFTNVQLAWLPASDNVGVEAYNVYQDSVLVYTTPQTDQYISGLTQFTSYLFGVTAVDAEGNESLKTTLKLTSGQDQAPDTIPPSTPGNLGGTAGFSSVLLNWDASTDNGQLAGYIIFVDGLLADTVSATTLSYLVTGLDPQTLYTFEVIAFDLAGNNSVAAETTLSTTAPINTDEPGLVAHYAFDGNANDSTPYDNHGVVGGNPVFEVPTHAHGGGQNIKFDGMGDSVLAPNAVQLISDYASVSFWIRVDSVNTADAESYIIDFGHWDQRWKISLPQHLKIVWTTNSKTTQFPGLVHDMDSGDGNEMVKGFWWFVTMVHDGTDDIIYVNGVEVSKQPAPGTLNTTGRPLGFGSNPVDGGQYFFGALDNVKIYNRAVTDTEVAQLFANGAITAIDQDMLINYVEVLYPNPATDMLYVRHRIPSNQPLLLRVFDMSGRQLDDLRLSQSKVAAGELSLNVSAYPQGIYFLNFVLGGKNLGSLQFKKQ